MRLLLLLLLAGLVACSERSAPVEPTIDPSGVYEMVSINGSSLPFLLYEEGGDKIEVIAGRITLKTDRTFEDSATLVFTEAGVELPIEPDVILGTYTVVQDRVRFNSSDGFTYEAVLSGDTLTQTFEGIVIVYRK